MGCNRRAGVLNWLSIRKGFLPTSIDMITDGTSTTIFCGELAGRPDLWQRGVKKIASCPCQGGNLVPVNSSPLFPAPPANAGGCWGCLDNAYNQMFGSTFAGGTAPSTGTAPVCFMNCTNQAKMNLYSFHPGSCGLAMCDGSAHMVSENIGIVPFCRMITFKGRSPGDGQFLLSGRRSSHEFETIRLDSRGRADAAPGLFYRGPFSPDRDQAGNGSARRGSSMFRHERFSSATGIGDPDPVDALRGLQSRSVRERGTEEVPRGQWRLAGKRREVCRYGHCRQPTARGRPPKPAVRFRLRSQESSKRPPVALFDQVRQERPFRVQYLQHGRRTAGRDRTWCLFAQPKTEGGDGLKNLYNDPDKNAKEERFQINLTSPGKTDWTFDLAVAGKDPITTPGEHAVMADRGRKKGAEFRAITCAALPWINWSCARRPLLRFGDFERRHSNRFDWTLQQ